MKKIIIKMLAASFSLACVPAFSAANDQDVAAIFGAKTSAQPAPAPVSTASADLGSTDVSQEAFAKTARQMMPLTPEQIKTLRYLFDQSQKAAAADPGDKPPKPTSSSVMVNLSPGSAPPVIRLRAGYITSLVFLDATGEPWPIQAYDLGNPKSFNIRWDQKSNTLMVQAMESYQAGNLAVMLKDHNTPVMITLMPGQQEVDYRVDLRLPGLGPNASPQLIRSAGHRQLAVVKLFRRSASAWQSRTDGERRRLSGLACRRAFIFTDAINRSVAELVSDNAQPGWHQCV